MKRLFTLSLVVFLGFVIGVLYVGTQFRISMGGMQPPIYQAPGDVNGDGGLNIADISYLANFLFGIPPALPPAVCAMQTDLEARVAALEAKTAPLGMFGDTLVIDAVNVQIVNGAGSTATTNGLGNLIVGYNEGFSGGGSHNIVVGTGHTYTKYGGFVAGRGNEISGAYASVSGGANNTASCRLSVVAGDSQASGGCLPAEAIPSFTALGANAQGYPEYRHDQTGIIFVRLPGGSFQMGSPPDELRRNLDEGPVHTVTLSPFLIAKYEVTQEQWETVMGSNPSRHSCSDCPVEQVSWNGIQAFEGVTDLSLPTEAQWEFACRAGNLGRLGGTGGLGSMGWYFGNSFTDGGGGPSTHRVGQKAPNDFGLYDMHGNVREWCEDVYDAAFYSSPDAVAPDPVSMAGSEARVHRGGSFNGCTPGRDGRCSSADRDSGGPDTGGSFIGFRAAFWPLP